MLDVAFGEDQSRIRRKNAEQSMATIRTLVLNVIKPDEDRKGGATAKRRITGWDIDYLEPLFGNVGLLMRKPQEIIG